MRKAPILFVFLSTIAWAQPVHHWPLDESAGSTALDIVGGANGQVGNNCQWQQIGGHHGGALRMNGHDARVVLGPCDIITGNGQSLTLSAWAKPDIVSQSERILIAKTTGPSTSDFVWSLSLVNATAARFRLRTAGQTTELTSAASSAFSGAWYHFAAVYDGAEMRLYINGALVAFTSASGSIGYFPQAPAFLGTPTNVNMPYFGLLDDVRIYDHALTTMEVNDLVIGTVHTTVHENIETPSTTRTASIHDLSGRFVEQLPLPANAISPDLDHLPAGCYLVCLQEGLHRRVSRLVVP